MSAATLQEQQNAVRGEEFQHAVRIIGLGAAAVETKMVVGITDDRNELPLHAQMFHLADEWFDARLVDTDYLPEPRTDRPLRNTGLVVRASERSGKHKRW